MWTKIINCMFLKHCPHHFQPTSFNNFYFVYCIYNENCIHCELSVYSGCYCRHFDHLFVDRLMETLKVRNFRYLNTPNVRSKYSLPSMLLLIEFVHNPMAKMLRENDLPHASTCFRIPVICLSTSLKVFCDMVGRWRLSGRIFRVADKGEFVCNISCLNNFSVV